MKNEVKLYFQDPQQLLAIFADLEDENLALIQECREAESDLEKIRTIVREVLLQELTMWLYSYGWMQCLEQVLTLPSKISSRKWQYSRHHIDAIHSDYKC